MRREDCGKVRVLKEVVTALPVGTEVKEHSFGSCLKFFSFLYDIMAFPFAPQPRLVHTEDLGNHFETDMCSIFISNQDLN